MQFCRRSKVFNEVTKKNTQKTITKRKKIISTEQRQMEKNVNNNNNNNIFKKKNLRHHEKISSFLKYNILFIFKKTGK